MIYIDEPKDALPWVAIALAALGLGCLVKHNKNKKKKEETNNGKRSNS